MKILIVDNAKNNLRPLKQTFIDKQCKVAYIDNVLLAVKTIKKHRFHVIISADELDTTTGYELLSALSLKYPQFIRIAITTSELHVEKLSQVSHYQYDQSTDVKVIVEKLLSIANQQKRITKEVIVKSVSAIKTLPSPPKIYTQLNAMLGQENTDSHKIADIIGQDPAIAAKVLQISNTSFLNNGKPVNNIPDAVTKIGIETLSCVVMTAELFSYEPNIQGFDIIQEQLHSLAVARFASSLVKPEYKQEAQLGGLLHDIGKVIMLEIEPSLTKVFFKHCIEATDNTALEQKIFGTDHSQIGGYLLHMWNFSYDIINVVLNHHSPDKLLAKTFGAAQAVYLANCLLNGYQPPTKFIQHFQLQDNLAKLIERAEQFK